LVVAGCEHVRSTKRIGRTPMWQFHCKRLPEESAHFTDRRRSAENASEAKHAASRRRRRIVKHITASVACAITLAKATTAMMEDCDLQRAHWVCVPKQEPGAIQQFLDRFHQTMDRVLTPPGGWRQETAVPPAPVPQASRPAPDVEWRNAIIAEAE